MYWVTFLLELILWKKNKNENNLIMTELMSKSKRETRLPEEWRNQIQWILVTLKDCVMDRLNYAFSLTFHKTYIHIKIWQYCCRRNTKKYRGRWERVRIRWTKRVAIIVLWRESPRMIRRTIVQIIISLILLFISW